MRQRKKTSYIPLLRSKSPSNELISYCVCVCTSWNSHSLITSPLMVINMKGYLDTAIRFLNESKKIHKPNHFYFFFQAKWHVSPEQRKKNWRKFARGIVMNAFWIKIHRQFKVNQRQTPTVFFHILLNIYQYIYTSWMDRENC